MSIAHIKPTSGTLDNTPVQSFSNDYQVQVINGIAHRIHKIVVHTFNMGDVDDPDIYAAEPLWQWQQSEQGQWVMAHAIEPPEWHRQIDYVRFGHTYAIVAKLIGRDYTFWVMKWGTHLNS